MECFYCKKNLNIDHDKFYHCTSNEHTIVICKCCYNINSKCPICKKTLQFHSESITRKSFFNPATRNNLGF